ncbi:glutamate synthase 1 [Striga asiatica]|uniref:Glutamate synthase 1 n=1 Tax=Striga asiatica TaxID=4170 RepID=A0A5A7QK89_STRAF|nr:glutamate synthase 1 [Striga asiatica]
MAVVVSSLAEGGEMQRCAVVRFFVRVFFLRRSLGGCLLFSASSPMFDKEGNKTELTDGSKEPQPAVRTTPPPEHENRTVIFPFRPKLEQPIMNVPQQVHQHPVQENRRISPKIPPQPLYLHHALPVHGHRKHPILPTKLHQNIVINPRLTKSHPSRVKSLPREILPTRDKPEFRRGPTIRTAISGLGLSFNFTEN